MLSRIGSCLSRPLKAMAFILFCNILSIHSVYASDAENVAELSLKSVLYSQYQDDFLNAITDLLVAEKKGVLKHLAKEGADNSTSSDKANDHRQTTSQQSDESLKNASYQNLMLIEASLYHYFGMDQEAEKRYLSVTKDKAANLSVAYLLLARYYYEQTSYTQAVKWLSVIEDDLLNTEQLNFKQFYYVDSLLRLGLHSEAKALLTQLKTPSWLPVLEYNRQQVISKKSVNEVAAQPEWFSLNPDTLSPILKELQAQKELQAGIEAAKKQQWANAVEAFKKVPSNTLRTIEARRWLAWSLMQDDQLVSASKVWRSLTSVPAYQSMDAYAMAATTTEQLGDKAKALAWFEKGADHYADVVEVLSDLRQTAQTGRWFEDLMSSSPSAWGGSLMTVETGHPLLVWVENVWHEKDFQKLLADHRDLIELDQLLTARTRHLITFDALIAQRSDAYDYTMRKVRNLEADLRLDSYQQEGNAHNQRLDAAKDYKDIVAVGTHRQLVNQALLENIKESLTALKSMDGYARKHDTASYVQRFRHLEGIQLWELNESYPDNFQTYQREVRELNDRLSALSVALQTMKKAATYAPTRFEGFQKRISALKARVSSVSVDTLALKASLRKEAIAYLDAALAKRQLIAQRYLEQSVLASARLQDELIYELSQSGTANSSEEQVLAGGYR